MKDISSCLIAITLLSGPAAVDAFWGALEGGLEGAIIGRIIGGEDGAADGAIIGGTIGAVDGAIRQQERERWHYRERYVPPRHHQPRKQTGTGRLVLDVQLALRRLGYNPGPADGVAGQATAQAIAAYKRDYGLPQENTSSVLPCLNICVDKEGRRPLR